MAGNRWDVEFARFFNYPRLSSASLAYLHPLQRRKAGNGGGTWILAESIAVVRISRSANAVTSPVISITVEGFVVIQKFAVRFRTSCDAENFLNSVKECFHKTADIVPVGCDVVFENSSPPDFSTSNALHYRFDEESSFEEPIATRAPEIPTWTYKDTPPERALSPLLANNIETVFSGLPPSFTELLTNCLTDTGKEQSTAEQNVKHRTLNTASIPDQPVQGGSALPYFMGDADLKSQIAKYMADDSFHDMLFKIEKVIDEMGGDLSL